MENIVSSEFRSRSSQRRGSFPYFTKIGSRLSDFLYEKFLRTYFKNLSSILIVVFGWQFNITLDTEYLYDFWCTNILSKSEAN